ncbi:DUF397 domain-containing protein [Streptomyces aureus]|jgi:hypothetical protein|uniref:DUF397 domain-containing protein n=1 Tax=Streptomyces aureus TaxID=193461 RepID=UPI0036761FCD
MSTPYTWQKSSFSGGGEGNACVELASTAAALHLRESDDPAVVLSTTPAPVDHLLRAIRTGTVAAPRRR